MRWRDHTARGHWRQHTTDAPHGRHVTSQGDHLAQEGVGHEVASRGGGADRQVLELAAGSLDAIDRAAGDHVDLLTGHALFAKPQERVGRVLVLGVRLTGRFLLLVLEERLAGRRVVQELALVRGPLQTLRLRGLGLHLVEQGVDFGLLVGWHLFARPLGKQGFCLAVQSRGLVIGRLDLFVHPS